MCSGFTWDDIPDSIRIVCNNGSLLTKVRYKNRCQPRRSTKQQLTGKWKQSSSTKNKKNVLIDRVISEGNLSRKYVVQQLRWIKTSDIDYLKFKIQELIFRYHIDQLLVPTKRIINQTNVLSTPPALTSALSSASPHETNPYRTLSPVFNN